MRRWNSFGPSPSVTMLTESSRSPNFSASKINSAFCDGFRSNVVSVSLEYPVSASAQFGLGRAYSAAGENENARGAFSRALTIDPTFKKATQGLEALR